MVVNALRHSLLGASCALGALIALAGPAGAVAFTSDLSALASIDPVFEESVNSTTSATQDVLAGGSSAGEGLNIVLTDLGDGIFLTAAIEGSVNVDTDSEAEVNAVFQHNGSMSFLNNSVDSILFVTIEVFYDFLAAVTGSNRSFDEANALGFGDVDVGTVTPVQDSVDVDSVIGLSTDNTGPLSFTRTIQLDPGASSFFDVFVDLGGVAFPLLDGTVTDASFDLSHSVNVTIKNVESRLVEQPVPAPGALGLVGLGLIGIAALRRRARG